MTDVLPYICEIRKKFDSTGYTVEESTLTVQGLTLTECKQVRDQIRSERIFNLPSKK